MPEVEIRFPADQVCSGSFRLLELPPDLCRLIESSVDDPSLMIKGGPEDDAVLCTSDKTYNIRSVTLSNSVLVVSPVPHIDGGEDQVIIQDSLNELLELVPAVPKLHRMNVMLQEHEWEEGYEEEDEDESLEGIFKAKRKRFTLEDAQIELQASEQEIAQALKEKHMLIIDGALRPLSPTYLHKILELLLMHLVSLSQLHDAASVLELSRSLEYEHEVRREVTLQVMRWFGEVDVADERWKMDVEKVVRQVGLGILCQHKTDPISEDEFIAKWNTAVGDTFASHTSLKLLTGNYLCAPSPFSTSTKLSYFPCAELPTDPAMRFADLFLTRERWKAEEIVPYLSDIAVDTKDLDKLLLKYARALTDKEGLWFTARAR
ncbi:sister chromatid cohesion protein Dcc1 [Russula ochroleuca]|uniref:Sister chromatid cohesion protein Dcc1 n=1 Tax=Russula ochroleuca TaxID=152965 RepID=A0A9P5MZU7_9AGAM|nr:sister chromatid cohesion protein Dcc1 [Russula ochroleuca]